MQYDDFVNSFTTYENVETPKVTMKMPLMDDPLDISSWADRVVEGIPIVKSNVEGPKIIINNSEEIPMKEKKNTEIQLNGDNIKIAKQFFTNKLYKYHKNKGLDDKDASALASIQSAGIIGNLMVESGDPTLTKTDNIGDKDKGPEGSSYGIAQWRLDRRTALKNFAAKRGKPMSDFLTQLEFVWDEINGSQKSFKVLEKLTNSLTVEEATENFMNTFERPNKNPNINGLSRRIEYAKPLSIS